MITRPSTPQLIEGVIAELENAVFPGLDDSTSAIRLQMVFATLRHCASRAELEIQLMIDEAGRYREFARDLAMRTGEASLNAALERAAPSATSRLTDVAVAYERAGEAFSMALESAFTRGWRDDVARAEELLATRVSNECEMTQPVGVGR